jgi:hypothetical protein
MTGWKIALAVLGLGLVPLGLPRAEQDHEQANTLERLAKQRVEAARKTYEVLWSNYRDGFRVSNDTLYRWSKRWLAAERDRSKKPADQTAALLAHRNRMADLERLIRNVRRVGQATVDELSAAEYYKTEAEVWLLQADAAKKGP